MCRKTPTRKVIRCPVVRYSIGRRDGFLVYGRDLVLGSRIFHCPPVRSNGRLTLLASRNILACTSQPHRRQVRRKHGQRSPFLLTRYCSTAHRADQPWRSRGSREDRAHTLVTVWPGAPQRGIPASRLSPCTRLPQAASLQGSRSNTWRASHHAMLRCLLGVAHEPPGSVACSASISAHKGSISAYVTHRSRSWNTSKPRGVNR